MKQYIMTAVIAMVVTIVVLFSGLVGGQSASLFGGVGITRFPNSGQAMRFLKLTATPSTATAGADGSLSVTDVTLGQTTATWNPDSFSSSTVASVTVAVTGAVIGDGVIVSFDSATSTEQWHPVGRVISAGNVVVNLVAVPGTTAWNDGLNLTTSTVGIQLMHK